MRRWKPRAGEQGRGFAVVASEVRSLAGRSAEAAKEIKTLITDSVERVGQGSALADQAGSTMSEVVASIRRVTDIIGEISAASTEQSQGVAQIGEAVMQMDQATQQNAALVEEMAAASSLRGQAQELVHGAQAAAPAPAAPRSWRPAQRQRPGLQVLRWSASRPWLHRQPPRRRRSRPGTVMPGTGKASDALRVCTRQPGHAQGQHAVAALSAGVAPGPAGAGR